MIWTALIMGLAGSFHCVAMCGPLALAVPVVATDRRSIALSRLTYHLGRIITYAALGAAFGAIGQGLVLAGLQRWLSLSAGIAMLAVLLSGWLGAKGPVAGMTAGLKSVFGSFLRRRSYRSLFVLGSVNGLLPCGLVYLAGTASTGYGSIARSVLYMLVFGAGTLPAMLGVALGQTQLLALSRRLRLQPLTPIVAVLVAALLILRGMSLGIPYISPKIAEAVISCPSCIPER
jgi:sulfite exporter TauE/SafE